jgi:hypothetical protein
MTYFPAQVHWCGSTPCNICGRGYAPGVFRVEKLVHDGSPPLSDVDIDRIADRVIAKMGQRAAIGRPG